MEYAKSLRDALIDASSWASDVGNLLTERLNELDKPWWQALLEATLDMARWIYREGPVGGCLRALEEAVEKGEEWIREFQTMFDRGKKLKDKIDKLQSEEMPLRLSLAEKHRDTFDALPRIEFGLTD